MEKMAILYARYAGNAFGVAAPLEFAVAPCLNDSDLFVNGLKFTN